MNIFLAFFLLYCLIAAFCWQTVMCFDIWLTFGYDVFLYIKMNVFSQNWLLIGTNFSTYASIAIRVSIFYLWYWSIWLYLVNFTKLINKILENWVKHRIRWSIMPFHKTYSISADYNSIYVIWYVWICLSTFCER